MKKLHYLILIQLLVDSVFYGLQQRDISMGRKPDGSNNWVFFGEPTPDTLNNTEGTLNIEFCEAPIISHQSGFYNSSIPISITPLSAYAEVRLHSRWKQTDY